MGGGYNSEGYSSEGYIIIVKEWLPRMFIEIESILKIKQITQKNYLLYTNFKFMKRVEEEIIMFRIAQYEKLILLRNGSYRD